MRKLPLIVVEWDDTTTDGKWESDKVNCSSEITACVSVGWKLKSNRKHIIITPMRDVSYNRCTDRQIIPKGCVKSIRRLE